MCLWSQQCSLKACCVVICASAPGISTGPMSSVCVCVCVCVCVRVGVCVCGVCVCVRQADVAELVGFCSDLPAQCLSSVPRTPLTGRWSLCQPKRPMTRD